jgi:hypothetical protein
MSVSTNGMVKMGMESTMDSSWPCLYYWGVSHVSHRIVTRQKGVGIMSVYVLVIIMTTSINPTPTSIVTIPGFKILKACINAGNSLSKHSGISYECIEVK